MSQWNHWCSSELVGCYPTCSLAGMPRPALMYFEKYLGILKDHKWSEPQLYSLSKRKIPLEAEKPHSGWAGLTVPPAEAPGLLRATANVPPKSQGRPGSTAIVVVLPNFLHVKISSWKQKIMLPNAWRGPGVWHILGAVALWEDSKGLGFVTWERWSPLAHSSLCASSQAGYYPETIQVVLFLSQ